MIKNLILDLDDTIIKDEEEDSIFYKEALRNCGYNEERHYDIYMAIDEYEKYITEDNMYYSKEDMLNTINKILHTNYDIKLIDELLRVTAKYWIKRIIIKEETIKKLSKMYNLYIYTNYFTEVQSKRLENIGYLKYFKKVYGADYYGCKPIIKSFEKVLEDMLAKPEECIMIGDDKAKDILAANKIGMKAILYDYNGKKDKKICDVKDYIVLKDFDKIFEVLAQIS